MVLQNPLALGIGDGGQPYFMKYIVESFSIKVGVRYPLRCTFHIVSQASYGMSSVQQENGI